MQTCPAMLMVANREITRRLAANIRRYRLAAGLTQEKLAGRVRAELGINGNHGVRGTEVSRWEHGKHAPREEHLIALARVFGTDPANLLAAPAPAHPDDDELF